MPYKNKVDQALSAKRHYVRTRSSTKDRNRKVIRDAKNRACADCGQIYPYWVMQFDHRPGELKKGNIAAAVSERWSLKLLEIEISRCDVVCANCHATRTHLRRPLSSAD